MENSSVSKRSMNVVTLLVGVPLLALRQRWPRSPGETLDREFGWDNRSSSRLRLILACLGYLCLRGPSVATPPRPIRPLRRSLRSGRAEIDRDCVSRLTDTTFVF